MQKIVAAHPAGKKITCYVNPDFPQDSVINNKDIPLSSFFVLLVASPFFLIGMFLIYKYLKEKKKPSLKA